MHRLRRAREWAAHRLMWMYYAVVAGSAVDAATPAAWPRLAAYWMFAAVVVALVFGEHGEPLCSRCLGELPKHPYRAARQGWQRRWLRGFHRVAAHQYRPMIWGALYVLFVMTLGQAVPYEWRHGWPGVGYVAVLYGPVAVFLKCCQVHRRFMYHCPICWRGRGNDDDATPDPIPDPVPSGTKELQPA